MVTVTALRIAEATSGFLIQPTTEQGTAAMLIDDTGAIHATDLEKIRPISDFTTIAGLIGIVHLYSGIYLLTVDGASEVGAIYGTEKVYRVATYSIRPLSGKMPSSSDDPESKYLEILKTHLDAATLYFSYDYDLTRPFSTQDSDSASVRRNSVNFHSDFMWNYYASSPIIAAQKRDRYFGQFVLPLIYGYAKFSATTIAGQPAIFGLITRRSRHRAGTRYFRRGINRDGHVANFNETEQFLVVPTEKGYRVNTYLQIRGSVPVYWAEMNNLKYKPPLLLGPDDYVPARKHFDRSIDRYGYNYLVNLVNASGHEEPVKQAYENAVTALADPKLNYVYFDFHHECRHMHWERVALLLTKLKSEGLERDDYSSFKINGRDSITTTSEQGHVVRTNCMDCLDRTNVVQSMLGRWYLQKQLEDCQIIGHNAKWSTVDPRFNTLFQNIWADNADAVSTSYSGTGALKTDYTRTGRRTKLGALNDLWNSISRYIKNNFRDGPRQDGYDVFLGNVRPYEEGPEALTDKRSQFVQVIPYSLFVSVVVFFTTLSSPRGSLTEFRNYSFLTFFFLLATFSFTYMVRHSLEYVDWPKLRPLDFLTTKTKYGRKVSGVEYVRNPAYSKHTEETKRE